MPNYDPDNEALYSLLDKAIDTAMIQQKFLFNMKKYLEDHSYTRKQTKELLESSVMNEVVTNTGDLNGYLDGDKQCKEAYGHLKKVQVVKIRNYLAKITTDVHEYYAHRKPRRPKGSKNKRKKASK